MDKYYQCSRCGGSVAVNCDSATCTYPASYRTSGICGGSISMEITETDYNQVRSQWRSVTRRTKIKRVIKDV
jgi:transcription elongation factor Elf1